MINPATLVPPGGPIAPAVPINEAYQYDFDYLKPLAFARTVPFGDEFSGTYLGERLSAGFKVTANMAVVDATSLFEPFDSLAGYERLFPLLPKPASIATWRDDGAFAEQRLSGVNPMVIRLMTSEDIGTFAFKDDYLRAAYARDARTVDLIEKGQLYVADYGPLAGLPPGTSTNGRKYLPAPVAFFGWVDAGFGVGNGVGDRWGELMPLCIQIGGTTFTPASGDSAWLIAKTMVQIADANHHELSSHLGRTHLVLEAVAVATGRLLTGHPLGVLLRPHLRFTLAINALAKTVLINKGGFVDDLLGSSLGGSLGFAAQAASTYNFTDHALRAELTQRGVADTAALPHYPYRDDALLHWDAISQYVGAFLAAIGLDDGAVVADNILQAWWIELTGPAKLKGIAPFTTAAALREFVTHVIFLGGPQHSAVNFPQYDMMAFTPNMPLASYAPMPALAAATPDMLLKILPPQRAAVQQITVMDLLASYRPDQLGQYPNGTFDALPAAAAPAVKAAVQQFKTALADMESRINGRNKTREYPYVYLLPSLVTNSISV